MRLMIPAFAFVVAALAVARITRLITTDYLTAAPRSAIIRWAGADSHTAYLITCPWCSGFWVAAAAGPVWYWWGDSPWVQVPALALALSYATGLLSSIGDGE